MSVTGRIAPRKAPVQGQTEKYLATISGEDMTHAARVEELRQLVSDGRYTVDTETLAFSILRRALGVKAE